MCRLALGSQDDQVSRLLSVSWGKDCVPGVTSSFPSPFFFSRCPLGKGCLGGLGGTQNHCSCDWTLNIIESVGWFQLWASLGIRGDVGLKQPESRSCTDSQSEKWTLVSSQWNPRARSGAALLYGGSRKEASGMGKRSELRGGSGRLGPLVSRCWLLLT